jgi:hypothetical protein
MTRVQELEVGVKLGFRPWTNVAGQGFHWHFSHTLLLTALNLQEFKLLVMLNVSLVSRMRNEFKL